MIRLFGLVSDDLDDEVDDADPQVTAEESVGSSATGVGGHRLDIQPSDATIGDSGSADADLTDQSVRGSSSPFGESDQSALPNESVDSKFASSLFFISIWFPVFALFLRVFYLVISFRLVVNKLVETDARRLWLMLPYPSRFVSVLLMEVEHVLSSSLPRKKILFLVAADIC